MKVLSLEKEKILTKLCCEDEKYVLDLLVHFIFGLRVMKRDHHEQKSLCDVFGDQFVWFLAFYDFEENRFRIR